MTGLGVYNLNSLLSYLCKHKARVLLRKKQEQTKHSDKVGPEEVKTTAIELVKGERYTVIIF